MGRHFAWLLAMALFCAIFTALPGLRGDVIGSVAMREAFQPFRGANEPSWRARPAPSLASLALQLEPGRAAFGLFIAHADPHFDMFVSVYPSYLEARRQMQRGEWPLWNERVLSGTPLMASGMVQPANPFFWVAAFAPKWSGFMWMLFLQAFACAASFYLYLTKLGRSSAAAALSALAVTLTGEVLLFFPYGTLVGGLAFAPWVLYCLERLVRDADDSRRVALAAGLAGALAGQWLGANVQFAAYLTLLEAMWGLWHIAQATRARELRAGGVLAALGGGVLGLVAASCQLLPMIDLLAAGGRDPNKYAGFNRLDPELLLTAFFPQVFGSVSDGTYAGGVLFMLPAGSVHLLTFGSVVWLLVCCGIARGARAQAFWVVMTLGPALVLLLANVPAVAAVLALIPGFETSHSARILIVSSIGAAMLASHGLDGLLASERRTLRAATAFVTVQITLLVALMIYARSSQALFAQHLASLPLFDWGAAVIPCVSVAAIAARRTQFGAWAGAAILACGCVELGIHLGSRLEYANAEGLYAATPVVGELLRRTHDKPGRFVGLTEAESFPSYQGDNLPPNLGSVYGLSDVRGFVPVPTLEQELVMAMAEDPEHPAHSSGAIQLGRVDSPWLDRLGARYVVTTRDTLPSHYRKLRDGVPALYENPHATPLASLVACADVIDDEVRLLRHVVTKPYDGHLALGRDAVRSLEEYGAQVLSCPDQPLEARPVVSRESSPGTFEADVVAPAAGAYLRFARSFGSGFRAFVNDTELPVLRADYALQAVPLPPGSAHVVVRYEPESVGLGLRLSAAALLSVLLLAGLALSRRTRRASA